MGDEQEKEGFELDILKIRKKFVQESKHYSCIALNVYKSGFKDYHLKGNHFTRINNPMKKNHAETISSTSYYYLIIRLFLNKISTSEFIFQSPSYIQIFKSTKNIIYYYNPQ